MTVMATAARSNRLAGLGRVVPCGLPFTTWQRYTPTASPLQIPYPPLQIPYSHANLLNTSRPHVHNFAKFHQTTANAFAGETAATGNNDMIPVFPILLMLTRLRQQSSRRPVHVHGCSRFT